MLLPSFTVAFTVTVHYPPGLQITTLYKVLLFRGKTKGG